MRLLILGGTQFVGHAIVEAALGRGHDVTIFHRGRHEAEFSGAVEVLHGDRGGDLSALSGGRWDAVIDTSGYHHEHVKASAELLADAAEHYTFISTISVYADFGVRGITEDSPLRGAEWRTLEMNGETYGPMKVACEAAVREALPERHTLVRPGIIVGPGDYTDRFPYWCRRVATGGEVLAPGEPMRPAQWIDARDLAEWVVAVTVERTPGAFNAAGPALPSTLLGMLEGIRLATGSDAVFNWAEEEFLRGQGMDPRHFPFFLTQEMEGLFMIDSSRAIDAGLLYRPYELTVRDTLAWDAGRTAEERKAGIAPEREAELLRSWRARV